MLWTIKLWLVIASKRGKIHKIFYCSLLHSFIIRRVAIKCKITFDAQVF